MQFQFKLQELIVTTYDSMVPIENQNISWNIRIFI